MGERQQAAEDKTKFRYKPSAQCDDFVKSSLCNEWDG
jgi:hypothetical protein